jgi:hypothetical protein
MLSGSKLGAAWSRNELGAWSLERTWSLERLELDPRRTQVNIFFKSQCSFFYPSKRFVATQATELRSFSRAYLLRCSKLQAPELLWSFLAALQQAPNSGASPELACCVATSSKLRSFSEAFLLRCSKLPAPEFHLELGAALAAQLHSELAARSCAASVTPFQTRSCACSVAPRNPKP